jgi:hypothetical protein
MSHVSDDGRRSSSAWRIGLAVVFFLVGLAVVGNVRGGVKLTLIPVLPAVLVVWR